MAISVVRTVIIYLLLVAAMRIMGKRQLGDLQPAELVVTLLVADMAAVAMEDSGAPLFSGLIPLAVLVSLELLLSGLIMKAPGLSRLIGGRPIVVIDNGKPDQKAMRKLRLTVDDILGSLRQQGIFDPDTVQYAIVETNGSISVCLKTPFRPMALGDRNTPPPEEGVPFLIVSDGIVSRWGLSMAGLDETWLENYLKTADCRMEDVFLLTADQFGKTYLVQKEGAPCKD